MQEIRSFTYKDYIKWTKGTVGLKEETEICKLEKVHQYKDKGFKIILDNKEEVVQLIN